MFESSLNESRTDVERMNMERHKAYQDLADKILELKKLQDDFRVMEAAFKWEEAES